MRIKGISFIELVELLDKHGFPNLHSLEQMEPNPTKCTVNQWRFAVALIARSTGLKPQRIRQRLKTPREILVAFNTALRKTGLVVEMQHVKAVSEKDLALPGEWDEEWLDREVGKNERSHVRS